MFYDIWIYQKKEGIYLNFWWANYKQTYKQEIENSYIWSPNNSNTIWNIIEPMYSIK